MTALQPARFSPWAWIKAIRETDFGNPKTRLLAYEHLAFVNQQGLAEPPLSRLADALDVTTRQVKNLRGDLVHRGFLFLEDKGDGRSRASVYRLTLPSKQATRNGETVTLLNGETSGRFPFPVSHAANAANQLTGQASAGEALPAFISPLAIGTTSSYLEEPKDQEGKSSLAFQAKTEISHLVKPLTTEIINPVALTPSAATTRTASTDALLPWLRPVRNAPHRIDDDLTGPEPLPWAAPDFIEADAFEPLTRAM